MRNLNEVKLIGNLGADPKVTYTQSSIAVTNISIATSESWKDKTTGEEKTSVDWHQIVAFKKTAELMAEYLKKGSHVYISGSLRTRKYTDKSSVERYRTEIVANDFILLDKKPDDVLGDVPSAEKYDED